MAQVKIEKLDSQGRGIGYVNDKIIFVPKTIPGEICEVEILKDKRRFQDGRLKKVLQPSEKRTVAKCPYYDQCGGCDFEHISYEGSVLWKERNLEELFSRVGLWNKEILVVGSKNPWNYRNKVSLKVVHGKFGYYVSETHSFVEISECAIANQAINSVLKDFSSYSFLNGEIIIRCNENDEILMDLITDEEVSISNDFPDCHKIAGILINHKCVYGKPYFFERKNGVLYQVHMNSFFQVNPEISGELMLYVRNVLRSAQNILDLYCGCGTLGLQLDKSKINLTGIEVVQSAVLNAISNAKLNHVSHASFHLGKVENIIDKLDLQYDAIIVDPPRNGLDSITKNTILKYRAQQILYVSCNPITLVRDLKDLSCQYQLQSVQGFDMFPYTKHVECVCVLKLK